MRTNHAAALVLGALLVGALAVRMAVAIWSVNAIWPDEIFQTLEQAHRAAFGYGIVPWEFRQASRSWLLPGALAGAMQLGAALGLRPPIAAAALLAVVSVVPLALLFARARERAGTVAALLAGLVFVSWFELVYFAPKALNEVVAGHLLLSALLMNAQRRPQSVAALLGLVCVLRVQLAPVACVVLALAVRQLERPRWRALAIAFALPVLAAGLLDACTWSYPFESFVNNVRVNVVEGKSARYGVAPAWAYVAAELDVLSWAALPLYALAALGTRAQPRLALAALLALAVHSALGHKEYRFIFPVLAAVAALSALGVAELAARRKLLAAGALLLVIAASALRAREFHTDRTTLGLQLYAPSLHWSNGRGPLLGFSLLGERDATCGVGLLGVPWFLTGGYAWLQRDVPIVELRSLDELTRQASHVDALLVAEGLPARIGAYEQLACWPGACAYGRPGGCASLGDYSLNRVLAERGE